MELSPHVKYAFPLKDIDRPIADKREFNFVKLKNGLEAVLITDPECERAACSLCVFAGSLLEPDDLLGCAHFTEHMLFLGTEKYSDENSYSTYIQQHAGMRNAFTSDIITCYFFSVTSDALQGAVDRFAQFFSNPLFTPSALDREIDAVDSEFTNSLLNEAFRISQILKVVVNPKHPLSRFSVGNQQSLRNVSKDGLSNRDQVIRFYKTYYSANNMKLCILGKESFQDLLKYITDDAFEKIKNSYVEIPRGLDIGGTNLPFLPESLNQLIRMLPIEDTRTLIMTWVLPEQTRFWRTKPVSYISHLLGHEGKGSALSLLKDKGYATKVGCGPFVSTNYAGVFQLSCEMELTELGSKNLKEIGKIIYDYIHLMKSTPVREDILKEVIDLAELRFRYKSLSTPESDVTDISAKLHYMPEEYILSGDHCIFESSAQDVENMLSHLTPKNQIIFSLDSAYEGISSNWKKEEWYKIPYDKQYIDKELNDYWVSEPVYTKPTSTNPVSLHFPEENKYVPHDFSIKSFMKDAVKFPVEITGNKYPAIKCYFKQDDTFKLPKCSSYFKICSPYGRFSPSELVVVELFATCIAEGLNEETYSARLANLHGSISALADNHFLGESTTGMFLTICGFNDSFKALVKTYIDHIKNVKFTENHFNTAKDAMIQNLKVKITNERLHSQCRQHLCRLMQIPFISVQERLMEVEKVTFSQLLKAIPSILSNIAIEMYFHGNITETEARMLTEDFAQDFNTSLLPSKTAISEKFAPTKVPDFAHLKGFPEAPRLVFSETALNPDEENHCVCLQIFMGVTTPEASALLQLTDAYLGDRFFDTLRTKQQLGYIVTSFLGSVLSVDFFSFLVQGKAASPDVILQRIEAFIEHFLQNIEKELTDEEFEKIKAATIKELLEKPTSMEREIRDYMKEWHRRRYQFNRRQLKADFLKSITREQYIDFCKKKIMTAPWLACQVTARKESASKAPERMTEYVVPLEPKNPQKWHVIEGKVESFIAEHATQFFKFPLPSEFLCEELFKSSK